MAECANFWRNIQPCLQVHSLFPSFPLATGPGLRTQLWF